MKFKCIKEHGAITPKRNNPTDAGMDICIVGYSKWNDVENKMEDAIWFDENPQDGHVVLKPNERILARTGLKIEMPKSINSEHVYELQVRPRSGLAIKDGITILNTPGTIDESYRGEICVILYNTSNKPKFLFNGDKIAQLVINTVLVNEEFETVDEFKNETERGENGFGSSDVKKEN